MQVLDQGALQRALRIGLNDDGGNLLEAGAPCRAQPALPRNELEAAPRPSL